MAVTDYIDLLTSEYINQPNLVAWLTAALNKVNDGVTVINAIDDAFSVADAVGIQLDVLGLIVGANRDTGVVLSTGSTVLDDDHYRLLIQAKIAANQWDGTTPGLYSMWTSVFSNSAIRVQDNQNMTLDITISGITDAVAEEMINAGLIIPKPMGVSITSVSFTTVLTWNELEDSNATWDMVDAYTWDQLELSSSVS